MIAAVFYVTIEETTDIGAFMRSCLLQRLVPLAATVTSLGLLGACQSPAAIETAREEANLAKAILCMEIMEVELDVERFGEECVAEGHIEHAPHVPDGKEGLVDYFRGRVERFPQMHGEIKRAGADGDLVWMHMHFKAEPGVAGNSVMHVFRMEDGKFAEHWGVGTPVRESELHDNSMF